MRRLLRALKRAGIFDGVWTLTASLGSKLQTLVLMSVAGAMGGVGQLGVVILTVSTGVLAASLVDLGFSTQINRSFAAGDLVDKTVILRPLFARIVVLLPLAVLLGLVVLLGTVPNSPAIWIGALSVYAMSYLGSSVATRLAYGAGRFQSGSTLNGLVRAVTIPLFFGAHLLSLPAWSLLVTLALGETIIAFFQYRLVAGVQSGSPSVLGREDDSAMLSFRRTWQYGVAPVANTVMNRSDTVVVSFFASVSAIGLYGLASQLENALTTVALIPAGAAVTYAARAGSARAARGQGLIVTAVVSVAYVVVAIPVMLFPTEIAALIFSVDVHDPLPIRLCVAAGIFSCLGGVATQQLTGLGRPRDLMMVWIGTLLIGVGSFAALTPVAGAVGAATAALVRDLVFFTLSWTFLVRATKKSQ